MSSTTVTSSSSSSILPLIAPPQSFCSNPDRPASSHITKQNLSEFASSSALPLSTPESNVFLDSLISQPHTVVRDFAYPVSHPLHYGTIVHTSQPSSGFSTPVSENAERLSDTLDSWDSKSFWGSRSYGEELVDSELVAQINFGDGPPWSEDEDLQSPVVVSSRHRKYKSSGSSFGRRRRSSKETEEEITNKIGQTSYEQDGRYFLTSSEDSCKRYYVSQDDENGSPKSDIVAYPNSEGRHFDPYDLSGRRDSHFAGTLPKRSYEDVIHDFSGSETSSTSSSDTTPREESRYSRDYQFTITSSDEEMHGQAVALFDFISENENELPLIEGQVIWVSYRYGQGWLVAEDPKSQESGLVPESYVRLLRDIHGDLNSSTGHVNELMNSYGDSGTRSSSEFGRISGKLSNSYDYHAPIVSTFSTSSKDLNPYPHYLLATYAGQVPPQVIHYQTQRSSSQLNTPVNLISSDSTLSPSNSGCLCSTPIATLLPVTNLKSPRSDELDSSPQTLSNTSAVQSEAQHDTLPRDH